MHYGFNTDDVKQAGAALLLYALYRSRGRDSFINGVETWNRMESLCRGACRKSSTTSEFVTKFKQAAGIGAIKPRYLSDPDAETGLQVLSDGSVVGSSEVKTYRTDIIRDNEIRSVIERDYPLIIMLIRERVQREKFEMAEEESEDEED